MTELYAVPSLEPGGGDGGDGGDEEAKENLRKLSFLAKQIMDAALAKIDWDTYEAIAGMVTADASDAATVVYLMSKAVVTVEIADGLLD